MKKKILGATFVVAMMAVAGYNMYMNQTKNGISEITLENIEALAQIETQRDTKDCVYHKTDICIAMHPTDPSKDKERSNAIWP